MKKFDPKQILIDRRSASVDLAEQAASLKEYARRRLDTVAYRMSFKVVEEIVEHHQESMSEWERIAHKILVNDYWIWYKDLRNLNRPCPGNEKAIKYIKMHNRLHPSCEKMQKNFSVQL